MCPPVGHIVEGTIPAAAIAAAGFVSVTRHHKTLVCYALPFDFDAIGDTGDD